MTYQKVRNLFFNGEIKKKFFNRKKATNLLNQGNANQTFDDERYAEYASFYFQATRWK